MDINSTIQAGKLTYDSLIVITHSTPIIVILGIIWFLPLLIYLLIGATRGAKTSSGKKLSKRMIQTSGFWIGWFLWFFLQALLILSLLIFPFWLLI